MCPIGFVSDRVCVRSGLCPIGTVSDGDCVRSGLCPIGPVSDRVRVRSGLCPIGTVSDREISLCPIENVRNRDDPLLGIRSAWKEDLQATAADMVYGQSLRLPGEFLGSLHRGDNAADNVTDFVKELRQHLRELRPTKVSCHGRGKTFVFKDLVISEEVFVRHDGLKQPLQQPYDGPYKVIKRAEKTFVVRMNGRDVTVSIDRLKPAYIMTDDPVAPQEGNNDEVAPSPTEEDAVITDPPNTQQKATQENLTKHITKSGRRVRFPDRLQGGFS
ncbi:hypothetical protein CAJAP_01927 [Camponotus japonicus]